MDSGGGVVRPRRSAPAVGVTGATTPLGRAVLDRLASDPSRPHVVELAGEPTRTDLDGIGTIVHLATDRGAATPPAQRRAVNVHGTEQLLDAAVAAGVRRVVLLTSAMVYGAEPTNDVPL